MCGRSFGGLIATNMAATTIGKKMFKSVALVTPYYRLYDESLYSKAWYINLIGKIAPHYTIDRPSK